MTAAAESRSGALFAALSVALFSAFTLSSRLGLASTLRPPDLAALRFGIGGLLLAPVVLRHGLSGVRWRDAAGLALFGGLGFATLAYAGFALAPAAHGAVLLHGTLPLTTLAILAGLQRQPPARRQLLGGGVIAVGVALMAFDSARQASGRQLAGDGLLLLASAAWSAYGVLARRLGLPPVRAAALVAVGSMACFLPAYALWRGDALARVPARDLLVQAGVQGVLIGAVSILVYTRAVTALGPERTALFTAAVPCVTTVGAALLLHERPTATAALGVAVVTVGMIASLPRPAGPP